MRTVLGLALAILLLLLSSVPNRTFAEEIILFSTQEDWNSGTTSKHQDVLALETSRENPAAGRNLILGEPMGPPNVFGDNFRTESTDGETYRWRKATSCAQSSGSDVVITDDDAWFNYTTNTKIEVGDGSMVMKHRHGDLSQPRNSTRSTPAPVETGGRNFVVWSHTVSWTGLTAANNSTTNKAFLFLVNQANQGASRILCGGFASTNTIYGFGWGIEVRFPFTGLAIVAPYRIIAGVLSYCESSSKGRSFLGTMEDVDLKIKRSGSSLAYYIFDELVSVCDSPWSGDLWSVIDLQTKAYPGAMLVIKRTLHDWVVHQQWRPPFAADSFMVASTVSQSNWTSPRFGDGTQITNQIRFYFNILAQDDAEDSLATICTITLRNANTGAALWVFAFCLVIPNPETGDFELPFPLVFTPASHPKVPFKLYFEFANLVSTRSVTLNRIEISLTDSTAPVITPGKAGPAEILVGMVAPVCAFAFVGLLLLMAFVVSARRLKGAS